MVRGYHGRGVLKYTSPFLKTKTMKALVINPNEKTATITEIDGGKDNILQSLYKTIGCQYVDRVVLTDRHDLWVDDEGLYAQDSKSFMIGDTIIKGIGVVLGYTKGGRSVAFNPSLPLPKIRFEK